jgi:hypothetical protein
VPEDRPLWRQGFDVVEGAVAPRLEATLGSERFAIAVGLATSAQRAVQRRTERTMRRALHRLNLPAGSDITRILSELGRLQRDVRALSKQMDAVKGEAADGGDTRAQRPRRTGT